MTRPKLKNVVFGVVAPLWMVFVSLCCSFCFEMKADHEAGHHGLCLILLLGTPSLPAPVSDSRPTAESVHDCAKDLSCISDIPNEEEYEFRDGSYTCSEKKPWQCYQT